MDKVYEKIIQENELVILKKMFQNGNRDEFLNYLCKLLIKSEMDRNIKISDVQVFIYNFITENIDELKEEYEYIDKYIEKEDFEFLVTREFYNMGQLSEIIMKIARNLMNLIEKLLQNRGSGLVAKITDYVWRNVDEGKNLSDIADELFCNKTYLSHLFKQEMGMSFVAYNSEVRMLRSRIVLKHVDTVYECAYKVGYEDCEYFSKKFKSYFGIKPTEYKQVHHIQASHHNNLVSD